MPVISEDFSFIDKVKQSGQLLPVILLIFAVIGSKFIMENIFELVWQFDFKVLIYLGASIGIVTLILIMLTNLKYLSPKVYPLIRNQ